MCIFQQETVVSEFRAYLKITGPRYRGSKELLFLHREESVTVYADDGHVCTYAAQSFDHSAPSSAGIVAVHGIAKIIIGICVETVCQFLALISLI